MSKFIIDKGYISEDDDKLTLYSPHKVEENKTYLILLLDGDSNQYEILTALLNTAAEVANHLDINKKEYNSNINKEGVNLKMVEMLRTLGNFIGYLSGCNSWDNKELRDYDKLELSDRLEKLKRYFKI